MKKTVRIFKSSAEAETADREYYRTLTPAQRIEMLLILRDHTAPTLMALQKDLREFIESLSALDVRFLIGGALAVAYHGYSDTRLILIFLSTDRRKMQNVSGRPCSSLPFADLK